MSKLICYLLCTILQFTALLINAQNLLDKPESIAFDTLNNRYLVSNVGGADIIQIEADFVTQSYYKTDLGVYCAGNHIVDDIFFVSLTPRYIKAYDLTIDELVADITIGTAASVDGMTADTSGNLYVVDTQYRRIYKISIADYSYSIFGQGLSPSPQDVTFDAENNRLLVCYYFDASHVQAISLPDGALSVATTTPYGFYDGITHDGNGNTFLATHSGGGRVYKYDALFGTPELISDLPIEPAGLDYNKQNNILAVPSFGGNKVDFFSFNDVDEDGILDYQDNCPINSNSGQEDSDGDGNGDVCDLCPGFNDNLDGDNDTVPDGCDVCPGFDDLSDFDEDGFVDGCDNCLVDSNPDQADSDADEIGDACDNCPEHYNPGQEDSNGNDVGDPCDYICGDADGDRLVNILDIVCLLNYKYKSGPAPDPLESTDVNSDTLVNILDIVYLINFKYKAGPEPECEVWVNKY